MKCYFSKLDSAFYFFMVNTNFFSYWKYIKNALSLYRQVCLFLKRGANQHATDEEGKDPLTIAVEAANADIVTL